jgi:predicted DNA-binding transcriptional regulator YafY
MWGCGLILAASSGMMATMGSPSTRSLHLLSLLQAGREWTVADLAARMQVSTRTVRRDAQRLRDLGYQVQSRPGPGAGYRLAPSVKIPPLLFSKDEISAIVTGLLVLETWDPTAESVLATRAKVEQVLPSGLRQRATATAMSMQVLNHAPAPVEWALVGLLADAVAQCSRIQFDYTDRQGDESRRTVEPFRHFLRQQRWYLVAFDVDRGEWRLFRLDRIRDAVALPGTYRVRGFAYRSVEAWLSSDFGRSGDATPAAQNPR